MSVKLDMLRGMVSNSEDLPEIPESVFDRLEAKLRSTDATTAHSAACLLWLSWPGHRGKFWNYFLQHFDRASKFIQLIGRHPASENEARSLLLLWTLFDALSRVGAGDSLPYELYRMAENLPEMLKEWPASELQRRRAQLEARAQREIERLAV